METLIQRLVGYRPPDDTRSLPEIDPERLDAALATLSDLEREVIRRRFGLTGEKPQTLTAIGREMHRSPERIRVLEARVLRKLRYRLHDALTRKEENTCPESST